MKKNVSKTNSAASRRTLINVGPLFLMLLLGVFIGQSHEIFRKTLNADASPTDDSVPSNDAMMNLTTALPSEPESALAIPEAAAPVVEWFGGNVAKPVVMEIGALVFFQAIGLPLTAKIIMPIRRHLRLSVALTRAQRSGLRLWKTVIKLYKNTGASKIVQRSKKHVHVYKHNQHGDEHDKEDTTSSST